MKPKLQVELQPVIFLPLIMLFMMATAKGQSGGGQVGETSGIEEEKTNFETFDDYFFVRANMTNRSLNFNLSPRKNGFTQYFKRLWYRPGVSTTVGLGVRFKGIGLSYSFKLGQHPLMRSQIGQSEYFDLRINSLGHKFGYDVYYQDYRSYFISNLDITGVRNFVNSLGSILNGDTVLRRDDMHLQNLSANFFYIFNDTRFSYRAGFVFDERQLKSAGSFLLTGSLGWTRASADSSFIPPYDTLGFDPQAYYRLMDFYTLAVTPGYAHNWVHRKGYFLTWGVSGMVGLLHYQGASETADISKWNFFLKGIGRASTGYHGQRWIVAATGSVDVQANPTRFVEYRTSILDITGMIGYRFPVNWLKGRKSLIQFKKKDKKEKEEGKDNELPSPSDS